MLLILPVLFEVIMNSTDSFPSGQNKPESVTLQPSWKYFFFSYIFSIIAIPIAGLGLIALHFVHRKHQAYRYIITNFRITAIDQKYEHNVDLVDINRIELHQSWFHRMLGIGTLLLYTSASKMEILGIHQPEKYKRILERAIQSQIVQQKERPEPPVQDTNYRPGTRAKINYLTGLWQQGLLSNSDYERERKYLE
jgi:hypothetical protein